MPQLPHDTADDDFHEIQLSGKQLFFLFMATTVVLVISFLCGVHVGRNVRADRVAEAPVEAAAAVPAPEEADAPADDPPAPVADPDFSYHERLQQDRPKEDGLKPQAQQSEQPKPATPPPSPAAEQPPAEMKIDVPTSGKPGEWVIQVLALSNRETAGSIVKGLIAKGYPAFLLQPAPGAPVIYRVQVGRYRDRGEAEQVGRRLEKEDQFKPEIKR